MKKIPFVDGTKTQEAYVTVNEQNYQVTPAVWTGNTPQRASVTLESTVNANTNYTLPTNMYYEVGNNSLEVYYCDTKLKKRSRL